MFRTPDKPDHVFSHDGRTLKVSLLCRHTNAAPPLPLSSLSQSLSPLKSAVLSPRFHSAPGPLGPQPHVLSHSVVTHTHTTFKTQRKTRSQRTHTQTSQPVQKDTLVFCVMPPFTSLSHSFHECSFESSFPHLPPFICPFCHKLSRE